MPVRPIDHPPFHRYALPALAVCCLLAWSPATAQIATGDFTVGDPLFFGPSGNGVLPNSTAQTVTRAADGRIFDLPLDVQFDSAYNLAFRLSPSQQFLYVTKANPFGGLSTVCNGYPNQQILLYELGATANPIPFTSATGPACIEGPLSHQPRFFDNLGVIRTMFLVGATDSGAGAKHQVLWADLVGRQMAMNSDTYGNGADAIQFAPSGNAALIVHGRSTIQTVYTFVDLCANPLGGGVGAPQNLPAGYNGGRVNDLGGGSFQATLIAGGVPHPGSAVALSTACFSAGIACCLPFGNCDDGVTVETCETMGGSPVAGDCSTASCVEACCQPDGSCTLTDFPSCPDPQGAMSCDNNTCEPVTEACCQYDGFCSDRSVFECINAYNGTPAGPGTDCSNHTCPVTLVEMVKEGPVSVYAGAEFDYTIAYDNIGDVTAAGAVLKDDLSYPLQFVSATGNWTDVGFGNIEWDIGDIPTSGASSTGQFTLRVKAGCPGGSHAFNFARMLGSSGGWQFNSNLTQTQILVPETDPLGVTVSSVGSGGLPVEGGDLITHTISLQNTLQVARQGVYLTFNSGAGMTFESVIDAAGGTFQMFQTTQWDWNGTLQPGTTDIVITSRVAACVNAVDVGLVNIFGSTPCGDTILEADGPRLPVRKAVDISVTAESLAPPTWFSTYAGETRYQIMRDGDTVDFLMTVGNPHPNPITVTSWAQLPFGFDAVGNPPFVQPTDPGATWNGPSRRVEWNGTLAPGQTAEVRFRAIENGTSTVVGHNANASDGSCSIWDTQAIAVIPHMPAVPHLLGATENRVWTFTPGVDTLPQNFFQWNPIYSFPAAVGGNGDIWVLDLPTFRINPVTLELQGFPFRFFENRLGFGPQKVAVDPSNGTAIFAGDVPGPFATQRLARISRYDPRTDTVTPLYAESTNTIGTLISLFVEPGGTIGFIGSNQQLYRLDPAGGTPVDIGDNGVISNYGPDGGPDLDGSFLNLRRSSQSPVPLADVDPVTGLHTVDAADLFAHFPGAQFGFQQAIGGSDGDVYVRYQFNGFGVLQRQPTLAATELVPFQFSAQNILALGFRDPAACADLDGDGSFAGVGCAGVRDCDDSDGSIYPGATEINDGIDNQCPGEPGSGLVDELDGLLDTSSGPFCWNAQPGAVQYEIVRSADPGFQAGCTRTVVTATCWSDPQSPPANTSWNYLIRALAPIPGSFGRDSAGTERVVSCP